jgi:hypothetical protein
MIGVVENFAKHQIKGPFYKAAGKKREELIKEWKKWTKKKYKPGEGKKEGELFSKIYGDKRNLKLINGKLYFYSDEDKENLIGKYTCKNKNDVTSKTTELTSCFVAKESKIVNETSGYIPIFNNSYAFISDNNNVILYDLKTFSSIILCILCKNHQISKMLMDFYSHICGNKTPNQNRYARRCPRSFPSSPVHPDSGNVYPLHNHS